MIGDAVDERRDAWRSMVTRAVDPGELPRGTDTQLLLDVVRVIVDARGSSPRLDAAWLSIAVRTVIAGGRAGTLTPSRRGGSRRRPAPGRTAHSTVGALLTARSRRAGKARRATPRASGRPNRTYNELRRPQRFACLPGQRGRQGVGESLAREEASRQFMRAVRGLRSLGPSGGQTLKRDGALGYNDRVLQRANVHKAIAR